MRVCDADHKLVVLRRSLTFVISLGVLGVFGAHGVALVLVGGAPTWASDTAWTLAGGLAFATSLAAAFRVKRSSAAVCWRLWACAAGCWLVGALLRDALALTSSPSLALAADVFWLLFAFLCVVGLAWRSPGSFSFPLFLLDTLPVVLLATVLMRIEVNASGGFRRELMVFYLYPAVYSLLALIALQLIVLQGFRTSTQWWLVTAGFWLCAVAAFIWPSHALANGRAHGDWSDLLWSAGLLLVALTGLRRALTPETHTSFVPLEREHGLRSLAPAGATLCLVALPLFVADRFHPVVYAFTFAALLSLTARFYLVRRTTARLLEQLRSSRHALQQSEQRFRSVFESSAVGIAVTDLEGRLLDTNCALANMLGYERSDELRGMSVALITHPDDADETAQLLGELLEGRRENYRLEKRYVRKDGSELWGRVTASLVRSADGAPDFLVGLVEDVSKRRHAEASLKESEQRFRGLVANVPGVVYRCAADAEWTMEYISEEIEALSGYPASDFVGDGARSFASIMHPDDREAVADAVDECLSEQRSFILDFRVVTAEGEVKWVHERGRASFATEGDVDWLDGAIFDVTESKRAEEELRDAEERYRTLFEHANDLVFTLDRKGHFTSLNRAVENATGYGRDELLELNIAEIIAAEYLPAARAQLQRKLHGNVEATVYELELVAKDGRRLPVELATRLVVEHGRVLGVQGIGRDIGERKQLEGQLRHQAFHDSLTGLPNRALFADRVEHALALVERRKRTVATLFLDLDDFKTVNDTHGHETGDRLLAAVGERLRSCLRPADTCARLGGDEFAILLEDVPEAGVAVHTAERILAQIADPFEVAGKRLFVQGSIGIALGRAGEVVSGDLLRDADIAMYRAKAAGGQRFLLFEPTMLSALRDRNDLIAELKQGLERSELVLHYQPIVVLETEAIVGIEALVRWQHPQRGLLPPGEFIALAEETGLIMPICRFVLIEACRRMQDWQLTFPGELPLWLSVNLSGVRLGDPRLVEDVAHALEQSGLPARSLVLEITETAFVDSQQDTGSLHRLKDLGVRLAIDDFGTGYASLMYLRQFPIEILKIDRSFIAAASTDAREARFLETIVHLSQNLGLTTIAEGIEQPEQRDRLRELHCQLGQGFHFSRPLPGDQIDTLLEDAQPQAPVLRLAASGE